MTRTPNAAHHLVVNATIERAFAVFTEPRVGGHIYDRGLDGSVCRWARILVYEPRRHVKFTWDIGPAHRHLDRHGPGWGSVADGVDGDAGWPLYLGRYADLMSGGDPR